MNDLAGEPVAEAEAVYGAEHPASLASLNKCWRYYYLEEFWDLRLLPLCNQDLSETVENDKETNA